MATLPAVPTSKDDGVGSRHGRFEGTELSLLIRQITEEQASSWPEGKRVLVEEYLKAHPVLLTQPSAVIDLIYNEFLLRRLQGETPEFQEYLERFSPYQELLQRQFAVHEELQGSWLKDLFSQRSTPSALGEAETEIRTSRPLLPSKPPEIPGYDIVGFLGKGGMGVVYQAVQRSLKRTVALKMILHHDHARDEVRSRFSAEAETIARFRHPNIVQVYEVGEHAGQPYLALEYVEGGSLGQRLAGKPLPPQQAAELVETLARAMQVAHEQKIIHRDLKPANVLLQRSEVRKQKSATAGSSSDLCLLTSDLFPKITDFGLAKRLEEDGLTQTGDLRGTPSYMAPEQVEGKRDIGPAADIYALGAILYECLTGRPPFQGVGPLDTMEQVRSRDPISPRRLQPGVPLDLETICLKCLEKKPARRYASSAELAGRLRLFLEGKPIPDRPVSNRERLWRWCRRKPMVAGLAAALLLAVLAGFGGVTWQLWRAESEWSRAEKEKGEALQAKERAQRRFEQVRELARASMFDIHDKIEHLAGSNTARKFLVDKALLYLDSLGHEAGDDENLLFEIAAAYQILGNVQGKPSHPNLGDTKGALTSYGKSLEFAAALEQIRPEHPRLPLLKSICLDGIGEIKAAEGQSSDALARFRESLELREKLAKEDPSNPEHQLALSVCHDHIGNMHRVLKNTKEALTSYRQSLAIRESLARAISGSEQLRRSLGISYELVGDIHKEQGDWPTALSSYQDCLNVRQACADANPDNAEARRDLAVCHQRIGSVQEKLDRKTEALASFHKCLALIEPLAKADTKDLLAHQDLATSYTRIGDIQMQLGRFAQALENFKHSLAVVERLTKAHPDNAKVQLSLSISHERLGNYQIASDELDEALANYSASLAIRKRLAHKDPDNKQLQYAVSIGYETIGDVQWKQKQFDVALTSFYESRAIREELIKIDPNNYLFVGELAVSSYKQALVHGKLGDDLVRPQQDRLAHWQEALKFHQQALNLLLSLKKKGMLPANCEPWLAAIPGEIATCQANIRELTR